MGFFARRLTTISIVYDFNNLGAALLARLDTFSVVNRATKSVFMGKRRQASPARPRGPSPSYLSPSSSVSWRGTKGNHRSKRSEERLGADPLVPRQRLIDPGLSHEKTPLVYIFARVYTREGALRGRFAFINQCAVH